MLIDIGSNIADFKKVKACAFNIYKGKLFKEKCLDEVALVVIGSEEAENSGNFDHISVALTPAVPKLSDLRAIDNLEPTSVTGDWVHGLKVACDLLEEYSQGQSYAKVGFILISSFESSRDLALLSAVQVEILRQSIDVICVGTSKEPEIPKQLSAMSHVEVCPLDQTLRDTQFTPTTERTPTAWQVDLNIGDIALPITGYKWVGKNFTGNMWNVVRDDKEHVVTSRVYTQKSDPTQAALEEEEIVRGYHYGHTIIPMTNEEKTAMKYDSGERGLQLICVTSRDRVSTTLLQDDTVYLITPSTKAKDNSILLSLIRQCHSERQILIVRQVYSRNSTPNLQVLYPVVEEDEDCLYKYYFVMVNLPFAQQMNDIRVPDVMAFNSFVRTIEENASEEAAMQKYLETLDLTKGAEYAEDIPFLPEVTRDPAAQVRATLQLSKYLAPARDLAGEEIPAPIRGLYEPPSSVQEAAHELRLAWGELDLKAPTKQET